MTASQLGVGPVDLCCLFPMDEYLRVDVLCQ